jgi:hypothetical protein
VLALAPVGLLAAPSLAGRIGDRFAMSGERIREMAASILHRGGGTVEASQTLAAGGGGRGSGFAVLALVCGVGAAGGGAVCVDQGVLPNPLSNVAKHEREAEASPAIAPTVEPAPEPEPAPAAEPTESQPATTPAQVRAREFEPQPSGSSEFGAPRAASSGSGGGGSAGGPFGFEK